MARRAYAQVRVYSDLPAAGGTLLGYADFATLSDTIRIDGDDRLTGRIALSSPGASLVTLGCCLEVTEPNATVREWIVAVIRDDLVPDVLEVTALAARVWMSERIIVRSGTDVTLSGTGVYLDDAVDALVATDDWPAWIVPGTFNSNPLIDYAWSSTDGLTAALGLATTANASDEVRLFGDKTLRLAFRRVSASQYALDFLTGAASGSPTIIEGKNLAAFAMRYDRTQQVTAVLPIGAAGASIEEAYFWVREADDTTETIGVRDWSYRADLLVVGYDDQWVGHYIENSSGTRFEILASVASTQKMTLTAFAGGDFGTDDICRIVADSSGTAITEVGDTDAANPRRRLEVGTWTAAINWARNAQWRSWETGPTRPSQWTTSAGTTASQISGTGDVETGLYALQLAFTASGDTYKMNDIPQPDGVLSPGGGSQDWVVGCRAYRVSGSATPQIQYSINGGASWLSGGSITAATMTTYESATFTTNSGTPPNHVQLRFTQVGGGTATTMRVDRVWIFRSTEDTGDNTVEGSDPARGIYYAARSLRDYRDGAVTYEVGIIDRTRDDPTAFPDDTFAVAQQCRIIVPSRTVDTTQQVVQVSRDLMIPTNTSVQLGALRRRLTSQV